MKPDLLSAVLADDDAFRASTLHQTLTLARRRRRARTAQRVLGGASLLMITAFLLRPSIPVPRPSVKELGVSIVRTAPLSAQQQVRTKGQLFTPVVTTSAALAVATSKPRRFTVVETRTAAARFELLTDQQLLTAFPNDRPALVARGTPEARIVFY